MTDKHPKRPRDMNQLAKSAIIHSEFLFLEPVRVLNLRVAYFDLVK